MRFGEALLDSHCYEVAMGPSQTAAGSCTSSIIVTGTRQTQLRPADEIKFQTRDPKWILKQALSKGEERSKVTILIWALAHPCKNICQNSLWKDLGRDWDRKCLETWHGLISVKPDIMVIVTAQC